MEKLIFGKNAEKKTFKPLNATNGGPFYKRHAQTQKRSNFDAYKAARIPYTRNHDSGVCGIYGGPYSIDITRIFTRFDSDVNDPASYDFPCTDESILSALEAGTKTFYRLGQTIEHQVTKHGTLPPADFKKWAEICEHIIMHYTEGWANGFRLDIEYWEIWNEPDLDPDDATNKRTWGGTKAEFFDLYEVTAKHLKSRFPHLKIGGPALAHRTEWAEEFLSEMQKRKVPIDFFSWHIYATSPLSVVKRAEHLRALLDRNGYKAAESILNEWNYVADWGDGFCDTLKIIHGMKGAAFMMATICAAEPSSIDMLMYYDTRPSVFDGVFDFYTLAPLKGYYALYFYGMFYDMTKGYRIESAPSDVYAIAGENDEGKCLAIITYYSDGDLPEKEISVDLGRAGCYEIYLVDEDCDGTLVKTTNDLTFIMKCNSFMLIKEV